MPPVCVCLGALVGVGGELLRFSLCRAAVRVLFAHPPRFTFFAVIYGDARTFGKFRLLLLVILRVEWFSKVPLFACLDSP